MIKARPSFLARALGAGLCSCVMGGWVAEAGSGSQVDVVARVVGVAGLIVAIAAIAMDWYLWHRSGPEIVVRLRRAGPGLGERWEGVDVLNQGRLDAVIRELGVMVLDRQTSKFVPQPLERGDVAFPVKVPPDGCFFVPWEGKPGDEVYGYAISGVGKKFRSQQVVSW